MLAGTNLIMLSMLLAPVAPQLKQEVGKVVGSLCQIRKDGKGGKGGKGVKGGKKGGEASDHDKTGDSDAPRRLSAMPGVLVFTNPSFREHGGGGAGADAGTGGARGGVARPSGAVLAEAVIELEDTEAGGGGGGGAPEVVGFEMVEQRIAPPPRPTEHTVVVEVNEVATGPHGMDGQMDGETDGETDGQMHGHEDLSVHLVLEEHHAGPPEVTGGVNPMLRNS